VFCQNFGTLEPGTLELYESSRWSHERANFQSRITVSFETPSTSALVAWANGDRAALDRLMPQVEGELRRLARGLSQVVELRFFGRS
jgi:hypothetical protein